MRPAWDSHSEGPWFDSRTDQPHYDFPWFSTVTWANVGLEFSLPWSVSLSLPYVMQQRIRQACVSIQPSTCRAVIRSFGERLRNCINVNGHHLEHLLLFSKDNIITLKKLSGARVDILCAYIWRAPRAKLGTKYVGSLLMWYQDTILLDPTDRRKMESRGSKHTLNIRNVQGSDFGNYSCVADNSLGRAKKYMELSVCVKTRKVFEIKMSGSSLYETKSMCLYLEK
ncbi:hypothetical protein ANN_09385 [Periplaneta americana]|uniref:Ig-like domain-containing protein n=1 Tax=Periplaneta americana TaxID=6978 RepID=A0ABQ8TP47_PERAM|nr:hypothetical protein ANN_09385 [Periplaneta americana]